MKRFGGFERALLAALCGGVAGACASPEDLNPAVLAEAENRYFSATATAAPATPPATAPVTPTTAVTPTATAPVTAPPPVAPTSTAAFAPELAAPAAEELEPADAIPLDQWLGQQ